MSGAMPWAGDHPVLEVLRRRRDKGHTPDSPADNYKVGLAVEGGGMRGVVSAAMLCALEELDLGTAFDAVYSASSGAINSAYFLGGDTWYHLSIYFDDLSTRKFVDFRRAFKGQILDLDYAFQVVDNVKPLDYEKVIASPAKLHVAVTLVDEMRTVDVSDFTSRADLRSALIASAWLPVAVRGTAEFRGQRVVDGGCLTPHPYRLALQDGCTHVLSLSTRPFRPPRDRLSGSQTYGIWHLNRMRKGLGTAYGEAVVRYRDERRMLQSRMKEPGEAPFVLDIAPLEWMPEVKRHELDPGRILGGARGAFEVMYCAIENIDPSLIRSGQARAVPRLTLVSKDNAGNRRHS